MHGVSTTKLYINQDLATLYRDTDTDINRLFAYCKGDNFKIHIWAWFGYFIC